MNDNITKDYEKCSDITLNDINLESDVGRIVKFRIDCINKAVCLKPKLVQWTDTDQLLNWFTGLEKQTYSFLNLMWLMFILLSINIICESVIHLW